MQCKHPKGKIEVYWSDKQNGWWAQCQVCEAHTAAFGKGAEAKNALKLIKREKPGGAPTDKGGRPKELPENVKLCTFMLCPSHKKTIDKWQKKNELKSRAEGLRHLLETAEAMMVAGTL